MLIRRLALALAVVTGLAACADDVGMIDRTQANYWKKSDFAGVWYQMAVVTDMPSSAAFGFTGQLDFGGKEGKIVFDIQENYLVVYPYAEPVLGADAKWNKKKKKQTPLFSTTQPIVVVFSLLARRVSGWVARV